jgi:4-hydroxy-tetrahydrodipicolinate synthase
MFHGSITALFTPFTNGAIDNNTFQSFIEWQISQGTNGLVPAGTTGESPVLSHDEHNLIVSLCVEAAQKRVPVIAGSGSNSTEEAIALTQYAKKAGADAALVVTPYYNKPSQEGLYQHYKAIHDAVDIPLIIYNIPGRCVVDMTVETMARLAQLPNIVGVKDATADLARPLQLSSMVNKEFCQLSGEDSTALAFLAQGGVGCISVISNIAPKLCSQMQKAWHDQDLKTAFKIRDRLYPLSLAMFCETNPAPVKYAAKLLGFGDGTLRLPLLEVHEESQLKIQETMKSLGLIS